MNGVEQQLPAGTCRCRLVSCGFAGAGHGRLAIGLPSSPPLPLGEVRGQSLEDLVDVGKMENMLHGQSSPLGGLEDIVGSVYRVSPASLDLLVKDPKSFLSPRAGASFKFETVPSHEHLPSVDVVGLQGSDDCFGCFPPKGKPPYCVRGKPGP